MALIDLPVPTTMSRDTSNRTASRPMRSCSDIASSPSSAISPSTAQLRRCSAPAAAPSHPGQRLQPGPHRVRVGVVGVVDHRHPVGAGADLHPVTATPGRPPASAAATCSTVAPHSSATAAAHSALRHLVVAVHGQRDVDWRLAPRVQGEPRPGQLVERRPARPTRRLRRCRLTRTTRAAVIVGHRRHRRVVDVEDHHPGRRNSLRQFGFRLRRWPRASRTRRGARCRR